VGGGYHAVSVPELASATWSGRGQVSLQKCVFVGFFLVFFFVVFFLGFFFSKVVFGNLEESGVRG
jgi:hypothetical protein